MYTIKVVENRSEGNIALYEASEVEYKYLKFSKDDFELELQNTPNVAIFGEFEEYLKSKNPLMVRLIFRDSKEILHYLYIMGSHVYIMQNGKTIETITI